MSDQFRSNGRRHDSRRPSRPPASEHPNPLADLLYGTRGPGGSRRPPGRPGSREHRVWRIRSSAIDDYRFLYPSRVENLRRVMELEELGLSRSVAIEKIAILKNIRRSKVEEDVRLAEYDLAPFLYTRDLNGRPGPEP